MDLKDKDFDVDPDLLTNIFEQLSLEPLPDLSRTLDNLDDEPENNLEIDNRVLANEGACENQSLTLNLNNSFENDLKKNIKIENDDNINLSQKDLKLVSLDEEKVPVTLFKEEIEDEGFHFIKSEPLTDSSSSDDDCNIFQFGSLIGRGKEEKPKKRSHKKKVYKRTVPPSPDEFKRQNLLHFNSGYILENHSNSSQIQTSLISEFSYNACQVPSPKSYYVNSPDSGFGSPSPPMVCSSPPVQDSSLPSDYEDQDEKKKKIQEIYDSILEEVKLYQSEESRQNSNIHSGCSDIEHIFNSEYGCVNSLETGNPNNGTTSLNYFDQPSELQVPDEDFDDLLNELVNELLKSQIDQSTGETMGSSSENSESITNPSPVLCYRPVLQEGNTKRKISLNIKDDAKKALRNSELFDVEKYRIEGRRILKKIKWQEKRKEKVKIIEYDEREKYQNLQQTNLHSAVLESNIEKVLCIIEALKCYGLDLFDINNQDVYKKTALDYAIKQNMPLLIDYLKENTAVPAINI